MKETLMIKQNLFPVNIWYTNDTQRILQLPIVNKILWIGAGAVNMPSFLKGFTPQVPILVPGGKTYGVSPWERLFMTGTQMILQLVFF